MPAGKLSPKRPGRRASPDDAKKSESSTAAIATHFPLPPDAALLAEEMTAWATRIRRWSNGIATDAANSASQRAYAVTARKRADNALEYLAAIPSKYAKRMGQAAKASPDPVLIPHYARAGELGSSWAPTGTSTETSLRQGLSNLASQALGQELRAAWAFLVRVDQHLLRVNDDAPVAGRPRASKRRSPAQALRAFISDAISQPGMAPSLPALCNYLSAEAGFTHKPRRSAAGITCIDVERNHRGDPVSFTFAHDVGVAASAKRKMLRKTREQLRSVLKQVRKPPR